MNIATLGLIVQGIEAAIAAAPKVVAVAEQAKAFITSLFEAGAITIEQQKTVHDHVDSIMNAALAGETPPAWQVEADPGSTAPVVAAPEATSGTFAPIPSGSGQPDATVAAEKSAAEAETEAPGASPS